jgi:hypothetical protein
MLLRESHLPPAPLEPLAIELELQANGYLILPREIAERYFPADAVVALDRPPEVWLLPLRGAAAGGLLLKRRNSAGDRSLLLSAAGTLPELRQPTRVPAFWDPQQGALRLVLPSGDQP